MCKKCNSNCVYFPYVDKEFRYTISRRGVRHKVDSEEYECVFFGRPLKMGKKCSKYRNFDDMKKYRKELVQI